MKKKLAVLFCVLLLMFVCTVVVAAEEGSGGEGEKLWDFLNLLNSSNVNYLGVLLTLLTSLVTIIRMFFSNGGLKSLWEALSSMLKNIIPSGK